MDLNLKIGSYSNLSTGYNININKIRSINYCHSWIKDKFYYIQCSVSSKTKTIDFSLYNANVDEQSTKLINVISYPRKSDVNILKFGIYCKSDKFYLFHIFDGEFKITDFETKKVTYKQKTNDFEHVLSPNCDNIVFYKCESQTAMIYDGDEHEIKTDFKISHITHSFDGKYIKLFTHDSKYKHKTQIILNTKFSSKKENKIMYFASSNTFCNWGISDKGNYVFFYELSGDENGSYFEFDIYKLNTQKRFKRVKVCGTRTHEDDIIWGSDLTIYYEDEDKFIILPLEVPRYDPHVKYSEDIDIDIYTFPKYKWFTMLEGVPEIIYRSKISYNNISDIIKNDEVTMGYICMDKNNSGSDRLLIISG